MGVSYGARAISFSRLRSERGVISCSMRRILCYKYPTLFYAMPVASQRWAVSRHGHEVTAMDKTAARRDCTSVWACHSDLISRYLLIAYIIL